MDETLLMGREDRISYRILSGLHATNERAEKDILAEFDLTTYKLNKQFDLINNALVAIAPSTPCYVEALEPGVWRAHGLDKHVLQQVMLLFTERSFLFSVLEYDCFYSNRQTKSEYIKTHALSSAKFYATEIELDQLIKPEIGTRLGTHDTSTREFDIRLFLFQTYYALYNGVAVPFPPLEPLIDRLLLTIRGCFELHLTPAAETKLRFFLKIWVLRLNNEATVGQPIPTGEFLGVAHRLSGLRRFLTQVNVPDAELAYVYAFLAIQDYLPTRESAVLITPATFPTAAELTTTLLDRLAAAKVVNDEQAACRLLQPILFQLTVQMSTFYLMPGTFMSRTDTRFFSELYPAFDRLILSFLTTLQTRDGQTQRPALMRNLYFSYMFALVANIPPDLLVDKVHVCVDFAQGPVYTQYIIQTLRNFNHADLIIESKVTNATDVYLSDFFVPHMRPQQVIWTAPPTATDWDQLADELLLARRVHLAKAKGSEHDA